MRRKLIIGPVAVGALLIAPITASATSPDQTPTLSPTAAAQAREAPVASAKTVTVAITARVETVSGTLCATPKPGEVITGRYTYTLKVPDSNPLGFVADYAYTAPPNGIRLRFGGGQVAATDPKDVQFFVELVNDYPGDGSDSYLLRSYKNLPLTCGTPVDHISWQLDDPDGTALRNTKLTNMPPNLHAFDSIFGLRVDGPYGLSGQMPYHIGARVTSAKVVS